MQQLVLALLITSVILTVIIIGQSAICHFAFAFLDDRDLLDAEPLCVARALQNYLPCHLSNRDTNRAGHASLAKVIFPTSRDELREALSIAVAIFYCHTFATILLDRHTKLCCATKERESPWLSIAFDAVMNESQEQNTC